MTLLLTEADVRSLLTMEMALEAVEEAFRGLYNGTAKNLPRRRLVMERGTLHLMSSLVGSRKAFGSKEYATFGGRVDFLVSLYDSETGRTLAVIEADYLGQMRTGAASGLATKYMARPSAKVLGLFGTGGQARTQLLAVCAVRPIEKTLVYSRRADNRARFVKEMQPHVQAEIVAVDEPRAAVENADVIVTMTSSKEPVFNGNWLPPGVHINAAGSNHAKRREIDGEAIRRCSRIAVDNLEQARIECGDLIGAVGEGILDWDVVTEFKDMVGGAVPGRVSDEERTLFESQGISVWDIATAARVYEAAKEQGVGQEIPLFEANYPRRRRG